MESKHPLFTCVNCLLDRGKDSFPPSKRNKTGVDSWCRDCHNLAGKRYLRTKKGLVAGIYGNQKGSSKKRGHRAPSYSREELYEWMTSQKLFHELYDEWVISDYEVLLKPTIDRLDDYTGYTLSNVQIMTWGENKEKGYQDRRDGTDTRTCKAVIQMNLDEEYLFEYHSIYEAERETGVKAGGIISVCKGRSKTSQGYKWKYSI